MASVARLAAGHESGQRSSARNVLPGIVTAIAHGGVNAEVGLLVNERTVIDALVTNSAVDSLGLRPGGRAIAMIKASLVTLFDPQSGLRFSEGNVLGGTVIRVVKDKVQSEVVLDIGGGCRIAAIITTQSAADMNLAPGVQAFACFNAAHVLLAAED